MENSRGSFFRRDKSARAGIAGLLILIIPALYAPFIANGRPLWFISPDGGISMPFLRFFFAPDSTEILVDQFFNFLALFLPVWLIFRKSGRRYWLVIFAVLLALPFFLVTPRIDKTDYRQKECRYALFAPIPYGPFEITASPYQHSSSAHLCGTDEIGRDLLVRIIYGARISLAVGFFAVAISLAAGTATGLCCGYFGGKIDLLVMRLVEILLCFPTFLLLLILMSLLGDRDFEQSVPLLAAVIGLTGWIGMAFLVRGEVLKQKQLPYIEVCKVSGVPARRILFFELLPNVSGVLFISAAFAMAGAIISESSLSFLGFGVRTPAPSWGGILRQAFDNPLEYWHLMLFPGLALFTAVISFNFTGEALRKTLDAQMR